jgi:sulfide dehydrogenase cytochrome subunit
MRKTGMVALALAAAVGAPSVSAEEAAPLLAQGCAGCHGQEGAGMGEVPAIAGYDRDEFLQVWAEFLGDARPATIMNRIARGYTEDEVAALAEYFASLR